MTHSYKVSDDLYAVIFYDGEEVGRHGAWESAKEAEAWAKMISDCYNDKTQNPKGRIFPTNLTPDQIEAEPTFIPNAPKEINSPNA